MTSTKNESTALRPTRANLLNYPQHHGDWVASWLPPEGTVCWQAALLSAAHTAGYGQ